MDVTDDEDFSLPLSTCFYTKSYFDDPKHLEMLPISLDDKWNFTLISIFLNEMHDFIPKDHCIVHLKNNYVSFNFKSSNNPSYQISINISEDLSKDIIVEASYAWLIEELEVEESDFESNIGSRNRLLQKPRMQTHVRFFNTITDLSNSSKCLFFHYSISLFSNYDFSKVFHYFVKKISKFGLPLNEDTYMLQNYINIWYPSVEKIYNHSFNDLNQNGIKGYFNIILEPIITPKKLPTYSIDDQNYYITSGVHVLNNAFSLLNENPDLEFDGFVLDTTWRIIPHFVTSILNICFLNTSLPLAFAFGSGETKFLYDILLQTVQNQLNIDFQNSVIESDEGPALRSICDDYSIIQLKCTRHFLEKLKKYDYFYEVKHLIQCTSEIDYENAIIQFSEQFTQICLEKPEEITKINLILSKIGHIFTGDQITIQNDTKWDKISLLRRIKYSMPSTTNTLEAMHGHLNKRSPRRNTFFNSLFRIIEELNSKYYKINERIQHNYYHTKQKTIQTLQAIDPLSISDQIAYYGSTEEECDCGQNKLESANYKFDIPCIHRIASGAVFDDFPEIILTLNAQYDYLEFEYFLSQNLNLPPQAQDEDQYIINTIIHFSRYKNERDIRAFVDLHKDNERDMFFINNQPVSQIQLIEEGIYYFKNL